eukprot:CAMPEP_0183353804 /NCGR_PEP_ID=MMETSP0164_2-20130417/35160_1 /TAXON_ID=221442 /ORGANISM="Coccolithus pelagicus ssp braarudi, Strain PLY182g" /LENGTH=101 /DNA_ID=CAMNT_0025526557 /DNA_START=43 /DNA_END=345 /DNA_ORIENTATION=-
MMRAASKTLLQPWRGDGLAGFALTEQGRGTDRPNALGVGMMSATAIVATAMVAHDLRETKPATVARRLALRSLYSGFRSIAPLVVVLVAPHARVGAVGVRE